MVQWTPNVDALFFKVVLKIHDIKVDYKKAEDALREEGIDVTAKALMHRITKLKATQAEPGEPGKASPVKSAKRSADGKPKGVIPDPEDEDADANGDGDNNDTKPTQPKAKKPRVVKAKVPAAAAAGGKGAKGKKQAKKEESDNDDEDNVVASPAPVEEDAI